MTYRILVEKRIEKEFRRIPAHDRQRIDRAILELASNPRPHGCKKLTDKEGYRVRVGDYRVLYAVDDQSRTVVIYRVKIRNEKTYK
ncbi:MAG TPA: type II toxin-antitoxin system RelE/ParE family toxin [Nitrospiria bacterium]|nr:type II toxin-antitoxin system RelE/ParE family toxin [Nitrospiria bacterium]